MVTDFHVALRDLTAVRIFETVWIVVPVLVAVCSSPIYSSLNRISLVALIQREFDRPEWFGNIFPPIVRRCVCRILIRRKRLNIPVFCRRSRTNQKQAKTDRDYRARLRYLNVWLVGVVHS